MKVIGPKKEQLELAKIIVEQNALILRMNEMLLKTLTLPLVRYVEPIDSNKRIADFLREKRQ